MSNDGFATRRFTTQDGLRLSYRDYGPRGGDLTPVLCLAGLTRNAGDFHRVAMGLASGSIGVGPRRVIALDYRGRGESDYAPDLSTYTPPTYLNDIHHLLCAAGTHHVVVLGTSLGGVLAMGLGAAHPGALAGVVLNDVGPIIQDVGMDHILEYIATDRPQPDMDSATAFVRTNFPDLPAETDDDWRAIADSTFRLGDDGLYHYNWDVRLVEAAKVPSYAALAPVLWPLFRSLAHVPLLILRGETSDVLSEDTLATMIADRGSRAKAATFHATVPGVGHTPGLWEPEAIAGLSELLHASG